MEGGEDEAVVACLPEELDVGGVGHAGHRDASLELGGRAEGLGHLLPARAPEGGREGQGAQQEGHHGLEEGEGRGSNSLKEGHHRRRRLVNGEKGDKNKDVCQNLQEMQQTSRTSGVSNIDTKLLLPLVLNTTMTSSVFHCDFVQQTNTRWRIGKGIRAGKTYTDPH